MLIKAGDKVLCKDASGYMMDISAGVIYTCEWIDGPNIKLVESLYTTKTWRFVLANKGN